MRSEQIMGANKGNYVDSDLSYQVAGCAMAVINDLGHGLREKTYERALCVEFRHKGICFDQQRVYPVYY